MKKKLHPFLFPEVNWVSTFFRLHFITPVKGHWMHLEVSHNVKTPQSPQRRNAATSRKLFRKPSNQGTLHLLLQHAANLGSHRATESFEVMSMCVVETEPVGREASRRRSPNLMVSLCSLYDCHGGSGTDGSHLASTSESLIIRLATDPVWHGCVDIIYVRESARLREVCVKVCVRVNYIGTTQCQI